MVEPIQTDACYQIRVRGHLDADWSEWFARMTIARERDGTTTLTGALADQAALFGVLTRVRNLGLPLISVNEIDNPTQETNAKMICRIWHGWTTLDHADQYEALLKDEIFVDIQNRHIHGFKGIQLLHRQVEQEVEFVTIMLFDSLESVREFAGDDYERAVVPAQARVLLTRFDTRSQHYEMRIEKNGEP